MIYDVRILIKSFFQEFWKGKSIIKVLLTHLNGFNVTHTHNFTLSKSLFTCRGCLDTGTLPPSSGWNWSLLVAPSCNLETDVIICTLNVSKTNRFVFVVYVFVANRYHSHKASTQKMRILSLYGLKSTPCMPWDACNIVSAIPMIAILPKTCQSTDRFLVLWD